MGRDKQSSAVSPPAAGAVAIYAGDVGFVPYVALSARGKYSVGRVMVCASHKAGGVAGSEIQRERIDRRERLRRRASVRIAASRADVIDCHHQADPECRF